MILAMEWRYCIGWSALKAHMMMIKEITIKSAGIFSIYLYKFYMAR